ncbi:MAG TPA: inositol monophosphatase family protein [Rhodothermales bacterium]|nr:inositol monophosphatase family protein [Rhodothermales bacterium]
MPDNNLLEQARDVAVAAAQQAGSMIRFHTGQMAEGDIREKRVHDLVTRADEASQKHIIETLLAAFPDFDILAEEGVQEEVASVADGYRWIIDPIDGTTNFLHDLPPYAVSIGLQHEEAMVVGVVLDVSRNDLFTAVRGGGTYRNGVRVQVSETAHLDESLIATGFPYRVFDYLDAYFAVMAQFMRNTRGLRRLGSAAVDLAYVACGIFDGFFETGLNAWDVAAGLLLVEEAGGHLTDFQNAPSSPFDRQILASNGQVHTAMLDFTKPLRDIRY